MTGKVLEELVIQRVEGLIKQGYEEYEICVHLEEKMFKKTFLKYHEIYVPVLDVKTKTYPDENAYHIKLIYILGKPITVVKQDVGNTINYGRIRSIYRDKLFIERKNIDWNEISTMNLK